MYHVLTTESLVNLYICIHISCNVCKKKSAKKVTGGSSVHLYTINYIASSYYNDIIIIAKIIRLCGGSQMSPYIGTGLHYVG